MEIKTKEELINYLENYEITYDYEQDYTDIKNACIDYMNNTQDWEIDRCFEDMIDYVINSSGYEEFYIIASDYVLYHDSITCYK